jgi:DNA-binding CsgD family transcriptional regulator
MTDSGSQPSDDQALLLRLTEKQRACLDLLLERQTSKQIARRLGISKQAVDLRLTKARDILGTADRDETAIRYARLRQTYDRITYDPVILSPGAELVPSDFPNEGATDTVALDDVTSPAKLAVDAVSQFKDFWRRDHPRRERSWIMAGMFTALVLLTLAGLTIGETLTRLLSS